MEAWLILALFFRCVSGSIFNIARDSEEVKVHDIENKNLLCIQPVALRLPRL